MKQIAHLAFSLWMFGCVTSAFAEPVSIPKEEEITNQAITMARTINGLISNKHENRSSEARSVISNRLMHCSMAYLLLSMNENAAVDERQRYKYGYFLYSQAALFVFPFGFEKGKLEFDAARKSFENKYLKVKDQKAMFYLLRNCLDFSAPNTLQNAVTEMLLPAGR